MAEVVDSIIAELILRDNGYTDGMLKVIETNKQLRKSYADLDGADTGATQAGARRVQAEEQTTQRIVATRQKRAAATSASDKAEAASAKAAAKERADAAKAAAKDEAAAAKQAAAAKAELAAAEAKLAEASRAATRAEIENIEALKAAERESTNQAKANAFLTGGGSGKSARGSASVFAENFKAEAAAAKEAEKAEADLAKTRAAADAEAARANRPGPVIHDQSDRQVRTTGTLRPSTLAEGGAVAIPAATLSGDAEAASAREINHALADRYDITQKLKVAEGENAAFLRAELDFHQRIDTYRRAGLTDAQAVVRADAEALAVEKLRTEQAEKQALASRAGGRSGSGGAVRFAEGAGLGRTGGSLPAVAGIVAGASVAGVAELAKQGLEYAQSLKQDSDQLGLTTRDLQLYRIAGQQAGLTTEELKQGVSQLNDNLGKAQEGSKQQGLIFQRLHIDVGSAKDGYKSLSDILPTFSDRLSQIPDKAERVAIETALGGKQLAALDPVLSQGAASFDNWAQSVAHAGGILSDSEIQRSAETAKKIALLNDQLQRDLASTVSRNADSIEELAKAFFALADGALKAFEYLRRLDDMDVLNGGLNSRIREAITGTPQADDEKRAFNDQLQTSAGRQALLDRNTQQLAALNDADKNGAPVGIPGFGVPHRLPPGGEVSADPQVRYKAFLKASGERAQILAAQRAAERADSAHAPVQPGKPDGNVLAPPPKKGPRGKSAAELDAEEQSRTKQFQDQLAGLQEQALRAQQSMTGDIQEQASIESALSERALQREKNDIETERRRNIDRGEDPKVANDRAAQLRAQAEATHAVEDQAREQETAAKTAAAVSVHLQTQLSINGELLTDQLGLARTAKQRRDLEQKLLDNAKAQEKNQLETQLKTLKPGDPARLDVQKRLDSLDSDYALKGKTNARENADPFAKYADSLPRTAGEIKDQFEQAAVDGVGKLNDALEDSVAKMLKLHGIGGEILKDFIAIAIKAAEAQLFGGRAGGGGGFGFGSPLGSDDDLSSGFGGFVKTGGGLLTSILKLFGGGRATGGPVSGSQFYVVGEHGPEIFTPGSSGTITPNHAISIGSANGRVAPSYNTTIAQHHFDLRGAVVTQELLDQMNAIGAQAAESGAHRGAVGGLQLSKQHFARQGRQKLG